MHNPGKLTGLFLGAGASCELEMPLVWELTDEIKKWLTRTKLKELNDSWRNEGCGYSDAVVDDLASALEYSSPELHYEAILGHLETQFRREQRRSSPLASEYYGLYSWLVEIVYHILYFRHRNNAELIDRNIDCLEGIAKLAFANSPLWVFSLNHDLIIECVAAKYKVPLNCGFSDSVVLFPRRDASGVKIGDL